jgi:catechol 2,3-dioxygenase-like lactoylglutathione lyase family enzyme
MTDTPSGAPAPIFDPQNLIQIGIVVKNIDATLDYFRQMFGFGPFEVRNVDYQDATYYGERSGYRGKRAFFNLGPMQIELIELIDGKTIHEEFLQTKGEGMHHIAFRVDNLEEGMRRAVQAGIPVTQSYLRPDGSGGFAYLETDRVGGVTIELIERSPKKR